MEVDDSEYKMSRVAACMSSGSQLQMRWFMRAQHKPQVLELL